MSSLRVAAIGFRHLVLHAPLQLLTEEVIAVPAVAERSRQIVVVLASRQHNSWMSHVQHLLTLHEAVTNVILPVQNCHTVVACVHLVHRVVDLVEVLVRAVANPDRMVLVRAELVAPVGVQVGQVLREVLVVRVLE